MVTVFFLVVLSFVAYKIGPVYLDKISFEDELAAIVNKAGANAWGDKTLVEHVVASARGHRFVIDRRNIRVNKGARFQSASRVFVEVDVTRDVSFPGYTHTFTFSVESSALMGRL